MICDRCKDRTNTQIMSMFNVDMICPKCKKKEEAHPKYKEARDRENLEVISGNYNFRGIGLPDDLR